MEQISVRISMLYAIVANGIPAVNRIFGFCLAVLVGGITIRGRFLDPGLTFHGEKAYNLYS